MEMIDAGLIYPREGSRPVNEKNVDSIAQSMREVGLINPISVREIERYHGGIVRRCYEIVSGNHRYKAAQSLGWDSVPCIVVSYDGMLAELAEIDENLIRHNLTPSQEAAAIARRKAIYEALHPETKHGGNSEGPCRQFGNTESERFTAATAAATGKAERNIQRAAARGEALGDDLAAIAGTSLDKGVELDALAKLPAKERKPLIERAKAGERVSARKEPKVAADPLDDVMACERQVARLIDAWNAAGPDARQEFLLRIDTPVFDRAAE